MYTASQLFTLIKRLLCSLLTLLSALIDSVRVFYAVPIIVNNSQASSDLFGHSDDHSQTVIAGVAAGQTRLDG